MEVVNFGSYNSCKFVRQVPNQLASRLQPTRGVVGNFKFRNPTILTPVGSGFDMF